MIHKNTNLSLRAKIFNSMILVATSLMLLLTITTSFIYYTYFVKNTSDSSLAQLDYIAEQFDYYMNSVSNYSHALITDISIQKGLKKYLLEREQFTSTDDRTMKDSINHIIQSTPFIHSVSFYSEDRTLVTTTDYYASAYMATVETSVKGVWFLQKKFSAANKTFTLYTLSMIQPVYNIESGRLLGYIEISIPENIFSSIYSNKTDKKQHIYITDKNGVIKSTDQSLPLESIYDGFTTKTREISMKTITFTKSIPQLGWYIISTTSFTAFFLPLLHFLLICLLIAVLCIGICLVLSRKISRTITSPLYQLIDHTQRIKKGDWSTIDVPRDDHDIALLFSEFNAMLHAQEQLKDHLLEATKLKNQISLDLIQQQVNPHFLYNTLDNICSLAELDEKQTLIDIVMSLSTFYRVGLSKGNFHVTIREELEITTAYLHIMQIRYFHKFEYTIHCPDQLKQYSCIKLLLQPIVENSIYHGIKEMNGHGLLEIIVTEQGDATLSITIQDNGIGCSQEAYKKIWESNAHFGIKNIHQRIQLYYGEGYGLTMTNRPEGGCATTIIIPKKEA